ncbi:MAG: hypothetical protein ABIJ48_00655 [Actinomycetota bacterium]
MRLPHLHHYGAHHHDGPDDDRSARTSTTLPADLHPPWGVGWAAIWPAEGTTATSEVGATDDDTTEVTARFEPGVDQEGTGRDRIAVGVVEDGKHGAALCLQRTEARVPRLWGMKATSVQDTSWTTSGSPPSST